MSLLRHGSWMVVCTTLSGVFMFGVHLFAPSMGAASYGLYMALLGVINVSLIPGPGIQTVFAFETARVRTAIERERLASDVRSILGLLTLLWGFGVGFVWWGQDWILVKLQMEDARALWATVLAILPHLWLPVLFGVLQGRQWFGRLGAAVLGNGVGRFAGVALVLWAMGSRLHWVMAATMVGAVVALVLSIACCKDLFWGRIQSMRWRVWLMQAAALAMGPGITQFMLSADSIAARVHFDEVSSGYYGAAGMLGRGLVMFIGPLAGVIFPLLVRDDSRQRGNQLIKGTAVVTTLIAVVVTLAAWIGQALLPALLEAFAAASTLPQGVREILTAKGPKLIQIAKLAPWFLMAMAPLALANIYLSHLVARRAFRPIGVLLGVVLGYGSGLALLSFNPATLICWVGLGNVLLLVGAFGLSRRLDSSQTEIARS